MRWFRSLLDQEFIALLGVERSRRDSVFKAVGVFRLNYSSDRPSPLLAAVYEKVKHEPLFLKAWNQRVVSHDLTEQLDHGDEKPPRGWQRSRCMRADLATLGRTRTYVDAHDSSRGQEPKVPQKFARLSDLAQSHETIVSKAPAYA